MNSVESDLATHQTSINEIASSVSSALSRISTNEDNITTLQARPTIYYGTTEPTADIGNNGDIYIMYTVSE